jgi:AcrR family transcriptional regulator
MDRNRRPVKRPRRYDSSGRREQAERSRSAIVSLAERLFLENGYASTTLTSIAAAAGVSVETVYKAFGSKAGLVRAIRERGLAGEGPIHAEKRSDATRAGEQDPRRIIARWGALAAEVAPRVSPILLLVRAAAATDPEMATLQAEMDADRLRRMTTNARHLDDTGHLRPGLSLAEAADLLWTYSSPELYELLVLKRGWTPERYGRFVADSMIAALLPALGGEDPG